jgi:hypothetical protein
MGISNESTASRQFVASAEAFSTGWIKGTKIWQAVYSVFFVAFVGFAALAMFRTSKGIPVHAPRYTGLIFMAVLLVRALSSAATSIGDRGKDTSHGQRRCAHRRCTR